MSILIIAVLIAPVNALAVVEGEKIIVADGATSPRFIVDYGLVKDSNITIDVTKLNDFVANGVFTTDNVVIDNNAIVAGWNVTVENNTLNLTLNGRTAVNGETVVISFTGVKNPWKAYTSNVHNIPLIATIANTSETASFNFVIRTGGLAITNGYPIISTNGSTSAVITITDSPIEENDTITIDVSDLTWYVVDSGAFTNDNVVIHDTAVAATWTALVDPDALTLTLTSTSGTTNPGDKITVTFTGEENPWIVNTGGPQNYLLPVTRNDQLGEGAINFTIETGLSGGLEITNGNPITTTNGTTSAVITITDSPIEVNDTITINVRDLHDYVANGTFTTDNVVISDSATAAVWTGVVDGDTLFLTSTEGPTYPGSQVTVTFTGAAGNPWVDDSGGEYTIGLKATRTDGFGVGYFSFVIHTVPPVDVNLVADFSASPTRAFAPATIAFTDLSTGNPTSWNWMFGDDGTSTEQNPTHLYTQPGSYDVTLTVSDSIGISLVSKTNYIYLNETIREANTSIAGLSISNCGGPQTVTVDTSILTPVLRSGNSELEIQPPSGKWL